MAQNDKPRVLVSDKLHPLIVEKLKSICQLSNEPGLNGKELSKRLSQINPTILIVRSTKVTKEHLNAASNLSVVIRAGAGFNTIDVIEASTLGIFVANCPGKNAIAVAELAMAHLLNMDRRIADNVATMRNGGWAKREYGKARGLYGTTLAVLGCAGQIGRNVCKRALSFGLIVRGYDPFLTPSQAKNMGIIYCATLESACLNADAMTVHIPYMKSTHHIINENILSHLSDNAYIINTSRGGIIDEKALLKLIPIKKFRVGLDVYENEPKSSDNKFTDLNIKNNKNIYGTHHIGASTDQSTMAVGNEVIRIISTYNKSGKILHCVNLEKNTPAKFSLTIRHADVVGVLAFILEVLRSENTNVQEMENIVFKGAKAACARLQLDSKPSFDALKKIQTNEFVIAINLVAKL